MANSYYNEEQRKKLLQGQQAQKDGKPRKLTASLDSQTMQQLKDINDNTLETALNTMDIKDGVKSFEDKFKEKFDGFMDQYNLDNSPTAEQSPDFVGPSRPPSLSDNSSSRIDNSVSIIQNSESLGKIEANTLSIVDSLLHLIELYQKAPDETPPDPEPDQDQEDSLDEKDEKDDKKKKESFGKKLLSLVTSIKNTTSSILSRFIGYSLEAIASFTKWTLLIGSLIMGIDIIGQVIKNWFDDILSGGEASEKLFGSYFPQIKKIAESIDRGIKKFDFDDIGNSLRDLFIEPFTLLGDTIKTAITEGIGNLIYALGEYTGSQTIMDTGRAMKISALRDKQAAGLEISGKDLIMIREDDLVKQQEKQRNASASVLTSVDTNQNWKGSNSYNQMGQLADKQKTQAELKRVDASREAAELEKKQTEEIKKQLDLMKSNPDYLNQVTEEENAANRKRVSETNAKESKQREVKREARSEIDQAEDMVDKDEITKDDIKLMDKLLGSLEEKNASKSLSENDAERYRKVMEDWQNKTYAVPENSKEIDPPPVEKKNDGKTASANNVQVNQKTVNNTVTNSVQRTELKPLISLS